MLEKLEEVRDEEIRGKYFQLNRACYVYLQKETTNKKINEILLGPRERQEKKQKEKKY